MYTDHIYYVCVISYYVNNHCYLLSVYSIFVYSFNKVEIKEGVWSTKWCFCSLGIADNERLHRIIGIIGYTRPNPDSRGVPIKRLPLY